MMATNYRKRIEYVEAVQVTPELIKATVLDGLPLPGSARLGAASYHRERREVYRAEIYVGDERIDADDWITVDSDGHTAYWAPDVFALVFEAINPGVTS